MLATHSKLSVSEIALGTWLTLGSSVGRGGTLEIVHRAYELGINLFDTADVYSEGACERALGSALRGQGGRSQGPGDRLVRRRCLAPG